MNRKQTAELEAAKVALVEKFGKEFAENRIKLIEHNAQTMYKVGGAAWFKFVMERIAATEPLPEMTFVNRSTETETWGGCLEGEWVPVPKKTEDKE